MFKLSRDEILYGNIYKGLVKIAIPLVFLSLINTMYGIVDTYFVGQIGELEVGAVSITTPVISCANAFCEGLSVACIALISMSIGKKDEESTISIANLLLFVAIIFGILACIIFLLGSSLILDLLNTPSDIYNSTHNYLYGISFDFPFLFILLIYHSICQGHGDSKSGVKANTIAAVLNCILDPIFIFVFKMGTLGAALATCLSKALVTPFVLFDLYKRKYVSFKIEKIDTSLLKRIFKISIPSSLGNFLSSFGFVLMQKEIATYGSIAISAYGIGNKISSVYYLFIYCWNNALTTFVGTSIGANMPKRARQCFKTAMLIVFLVCLIFIPLGLFTSRTLVSKFVKDISPQLLQMSLEYAYFSIFTAFFMGWMGNNVAVFNGSGHTKISMILTGSRIFFIRIPMIKLLNIILGLSVSNIWLAMCLSNFIVCLAGLILYKKYKWDI